MKKTYRLSCRGQVAAALALSLICAERLWAGGIVPAPGSNVEVRQAGSGAEVIQIARANPHGLSHNRYTAHDVAPAGAVYNNALAAGQSQLAGQLAANSNLAGQAATVILNEVVGRNPSLLLGQMEVFGQAADMVLANPNGITCNGCGFINTQRAALLVGTPQLQEGRLQALSSATGSSLLTIGPAGVSANAALDLIAPRIDAQGKLVATSGLIHAVIGQAQVDYDSRETTVRGEPPAQPLDSALLGGMQAGRINIISTDDGAGVNLAGAIHANGKVGVETQGQLALGNVHILGEQVALSGKTIDATPLTRSDEQTERRHDESWFIWKNGETDVVEREGSTHIEHTRLEGDLVELRARETMHLQAAEVRGGDIRLAATDIVLSAAETGDVRRTEQAEWRNSWQRKQYNESRHEDWQGTALAAERDLALSAAGRIEGQGVALSASNEVRMTAGQAIGLSGLVEKTVSVNRGDRDLEGLTLSSGNWHYVTEQQQLKPSQVKAGGNLHLSAGGSLALHSSKLQAGGDLVLDSERQINIGTQLVSQRLADSDQTSRWGGIGGSHRSDDRSQAALNVSSELEAKGGLHLAAGQDIHIAGSRVEAGTALTARAGGDVYIGTAVAEERQQHDASRLALEASAGADARHPGAYRIGVGLGQTAEHTEQETTRQIGSVLSGGSVRVDAGGDVTVQGSQVAARLGNAVVNGRNLAFGAVDETVHDTRQSSRAGGGIFDAAGIDQLRGGVAYGQSSERSTTDARTPRVSQLGASGDLVLHAASGVLQTEGAQFGAGGRLSAEASLIDNRAAVGERTTVRQSDGGSGELAVVAELGGLLKPVELALQKARDGRLVEAARDAIRIKDKVQDGVSKAKQGDWNGVRAVVTQLSTPSAGGLIEADGRRHSDSTSSQSAVGSRFEAAAVDVQSTGVLHDQATQYRSTRGKVEIAAGEHRFDAAANRSERMEEGGSGGGMLQATTLTGHDLRLKAEGNGNAHWRQQSEMQSDGGAIRGAGGVSIAVAGDARYHGTAIDGGRGQLAVTAGGALRVEAAGHTTSTVEGHQGGSLALSVRTVPQAQGTAAAQSKPAGLPDAGGAQGRLEVDVARSKESRQEAQPAPWSADAGVVLRAGGWLDLPVAETSFRHDGWTVKGSLEAEAYAGARIPGIQGSLNVNRRVEER